MIYYVIHPQTSLNFKLSNVVATIPTPAFTIIVLAEITTPACC